MVTQRHSLVTDSSSWDNAFASGRLPGVEYAERFSQGRPTFDLTMVDAQDFDDLQTLLRDIRLKGDDSVRVYERATIALRKVPISSLRPLSLYLLKPQLALHEHMFAHLMNHHRLNLFALTGIIDYERGGDYFRMVPPIVETYFDVALGEQVTAIIDGLHRIYAAQQLGLTDVWVVEISQVPTLLPPIAIPVTWDAVRLYDVVPHVAEKRHYRYKGPVDYPDLSVVTTVPITKENSLYFLYRDFDRLGSSGVRRPREATI